MRRVVVTLAIFCLLLGLAGSVAYAASVSQSNLSPLDIWLEEQREGPQALPPDEAIKKFNENKAIADQQKAEADQRVLEQIIQGARTSDSVETSLELDSKKATDSVAPLGVVKTIYYWPNRTQSKGGSGIGWSGATWAASDDIRNGSRAELYGTYWAKAWGWDYFTPSTSGNYTVSTKFYLTGRIISGSSLKVRVKVTDTTTGQAITRTIYDPSPGYFDNQYVGRTEQFYLYAGRKYSFTFETETNSSSVISPTFADFYEKEFDGTQRKIYFYSMQISS